LAHWVFPAKGLSELIALAVGAVVVPPPVVVVPVPIVVLPVMVVDAVPEIHWE
jgi:hypothetical protein